MEANKQTQEKEQEKTEVPTPSAATAAVPPTPSVPVVPPSLYSLLSLLSTFRLLVRCPPLDDLFHFLIIDDRTWRLITLNSPIPLDRSDPSVGDFSSSYLLIHEALDAINKGIYRKARTGEAGESGAIAAEQLENSAYTEELNDIYRVCSRVVPLVKSALMAALRQQHTKIEEFVQERDATLDRIGKENKEKEDKERDSIAPPSSESSSSSRSLISDSASSLAYGPLDLKFYYLHLRVVLDDLYLPIYNSQHHDRMRQRYQVHQKGKRRHTIILNPRTREAEEKILDHNNFTYDTEEDELQTADAANNLGEMPAANSLFVRISQAARHAVYPLPEPLKAIQPNVIINALNKDKRYLQTYLQSYYQSSVLCDRLLHSYMMGLLLLLVNFAFQGIVARNNNESNKSYGSQNKAASGAADASGAYLSILQFSSHFLHHFLPLLSRAYSLLPSFVDENIFQLSFQGIEKGILFSSQRSLIRQLYLFNQLLQPFHVYVLPRLVHSACHAGGVKCVAVSSLDNHYIVTGGFDGAVRIWALNSDYLSSLSPQSHERHSYNTAYHNSVIHSAINTSTQRRPGGEAMGAGNTAARMFPSSIGHCLAQFLSSGSVVTFVRLLHADQHLLAATADGALTLWNMRNCQVIRRFVGHTDGILDADVSVKENYILSASMDQTVRLWNATNGKCLRVYRGHQFWVKIARFSLANDFIITAGMDKALMVWPIKRAANAIAMGADDGQAAAQAPKHIFNTTNYVLDIVCFTDDRIIFTCKSNYIGIFHLVEGTATQIRLPGIRSRQVLAYRGDATGEDERVAEGGGGGVCTCLALSPDGRYLACGYYDNCVVLFKIVFPHLNEEPVKRSEASGNDQEDDIGRFIGQAMGSPPSPAAPQSPGPVHYDSAEFHYSRQLFLHNRGIFCIKWQSNSALLVGTASGAMQFIEL